MKNSGLCAQVVKIVTIHTLLCCLVNLSYDYLLMLKLVLIQFSFLSLSQEELDDLSDSGSDYEATMKATKRKKKAVPPPLVNNRILSQNNTLRYSYKLK